MQSAHWWFALPKLGLLHLLLVRGVAVMSHEYLKRLPLNLS